MKLKINQLDTLIDFGSFKGQTVRQVFHGNAYENPDTLRLGLVWSLVHDRDFSIHESSLETVRVNGEISFRFIDELARRLVLTPSSQPLCDGVALDFKSFWHMHSIEKKIGCLSFDDLSDNKPTLLPLGHPDYLEWCVKEVDWFCLSSSAIEYIHRTRHLSQVTFSSSIIRGNNYFKPIYQESYYKFSELALRHNDEKITQLLSP